MDVAANTLLHEAAAALNPCLLQCALDAGASPWSVTTLDRTALMLAIMHGGDHEATLDLVRWLLTTGTPSGINHRAATAGLTALMLAAHLSMPNVVQALIEAGADVETQCMRGETAWHKAQTGSAESRASRATIVMMLEAAGAVGRHAHGGQLPMPRAVHCDTARFAAQYRSSMACVLPGLVSHWAACGAAGKWRSRAGLIELLGGAGCEQHTNVCGQPRFPCGVRSPGHSAHVGGRYRRRDALPIADCRRGADCGRGADCKRGANCRHGEAWR